MYSLVNSIVRRQRLILGSCAALALSSLALAGELPNVLLLTTGGTIQSKGAHRLKLAEYSDGRVTPEELLNDLPELKSVATVTVKEISNLGSGNITTEHLLKLARSVSEQLAKAEVAGAFVTHGTGTLEETAYFLQLTVKSDKPVVVVGAMRPWTGISRDGPLNLYNAVRVAGSPEAKGKGVMVLLNDTIHSARFVTKSNTYRVETFVSREVGPIGYADSDRIAFYRTPLVRHTQKAEFDISKAESLPMVDIVYGYQEASRAPIDALVAAGAKGIVLADSSPAYQKAILEAQAKGVIIVQSDRKGSGRVLLSDRVFGRNVVTADSLNPQKARILLRLALAQTSDVKEIQRMFNEY